MFYLISGRCQWKSIAPCFPVILTTSQRQSASPALSHREDKCPWQPQRRDRSPDESLARKRCISGAVYRIDNYRISKTRALLLNCMHKRGELLSSCLPKTPCCLEHCTCPCQILLVFISKALGTGTFKGFSPTTNPPPIHHSVNDPLHPNPPAHIMQHINQRFRNTVAGCLLCSCWQMKAISPLNHKIL